MPFLCFEVLYFCLQIFFLVSISHTHTHTHAHKPKLPERPERQHLRISAAIPGSFTLTHITSCRLLLAANCAYPGPARLQFWLLEFLFLMATAIAREGANTYIQKQGHEVHVINQLSLKIKIQNAECGNIQFPGIKAHTHGHLHLHLQ